MPLSEVAKAEMEIIPTLEALQISVAEKKKAVDVALVGTDISVLIVKRV